MKDKPSKPSPSNTRKWSDAMYTIPNALLSQCPACSLCGWQSDKRRKDNGYAMGGHTCRVDRISLTSVTMLCRNCGLRFTVTWKSLQHSMRNGRGNQDKLLQDWATALDYMADTGGPRRYTPPKKKKTTPTPES